MAFSLVILGENTKRSAWQHWCQAAASAMMDWAAVAPPGRKNKQAPRVAVLGVGSTVRSRRIPLTVGLNLSI